MLLKVSRYLACVSICERFPYPFSFPSNLPFFLSFFHSTFFSSFFSLLPSLHPCFIPFLTSFFNPCYIPFFKVSSFSLSFFLPSVTFHTPTTGFIPFSDIFAEGPNCLFIVHLKTIHCCRVATGGRASGARSPS